MSGPLELARRTVLEGVQSEKRKRMLGVEAYATDSEDERQEMWAPLKAHQAALAAKWAAEGHDPGQIPYKPPFWRPGQKRRFLAPGELEFEEAQKRREEKRQERAEKAAERSRKAGENPSPPKKKKKMKPKGPWVHKAPANGEDNTAKLSDELLLRVLKNLDFKEIMQCSRVNKKWRELTSDGELWRGLYYDKFVKRDLKRDFLRHDPGVAEELRAQNSFTQSKLEMEWLADMKKQDLRKKTDMGIWGGSHGQDRQPWMARYKLASNWWKGKAQVSLIHVEDPKPNTGQDSAPSSPKTGHKPVAQLLNGTLYTADAEHGLRAWHLPSLDRSQGTSTTWEDYVALRTKAGDPMAILQAPLQAVPTAMKIEALVDTAVIAIGFEDGSWSLWDIPHKGQPYFKRVCSSDEKEISKSVIAPGGPVIDIALHCPYVLTITSTQLLRLHKRIPTNSNSQPFAPLLLHELTSHTSWPPYALSIRSEKIAGAPIIAAIAYAVPTISGEMSIGLQEIHLDDETGKVLETKIVTSVQGGWFPLSANPSNSRRLDPNSAQRSNALLRRRGSDLTLSYNHPHIVVGSGNNGLWNYETGRVPGDPMIQKFRSLLGHTSGVVAVDVDSKGKCVSVQRGGRIHVRWLDGMGENQMDADAKVRTGLTGPQAIAMGLTVKDPWAAWEKEWVASDEERIVLLREKYLLIYDFR